ncbi:hypothetical protein SISNIDRAFT_448535 [Sistotremastrum niveocremeum HHB9708]|uniref:Uncharacterized protein n=2 Tax=Sistotremastraceae TaxID=3402574 RepID=A0A165A0J0_9AGAM|nr:hypothetical protein SISNIDRAFT_448535 [Sistotremastrum niveocremeum HHB9708]KZT41472.1 hypothetical protein SISSUDRAFT_1042838 [Sistotremastrum suecicum HHB10207 ss-3]
MAESRPPPLPPYPPSQRPPLPQTRQTRAHTAPSSSPSRPALPSVLRPGIGPYSPSHIGFTSEDLFFSTPKRRTSDTSPLRLQSRPFQTPDLPPSVPPRPNIPLDHDPPPLPPPPIPLKLVPSHSYHATPAPPLPLPPSTSRSPRNPRTPLPRLPEDEQSSFFENPHPSTPPVHSSALPSPPLLNPDEVDAHTPVDSDMAEAIRRSMLPDYERDFGESDKVAAALATLRQQQLAREQADFEYARALQRQEEEEAAAKAALVQQDQQTSKEVLDLASQVEGELRRQGLAVEADRIRDNPSILPALDSFQQYASASSRPSPSLSPRPSIRSHSSQSSAQSQSLSVSTTSRPSSQPQSVTSPALSPRSDILNTPITPVARPRLSHAWESEPIGRPESVLSDDSASSAVSMPVLPAPPAAPPLPINMIPPLRIEPEILVGVSFGFDTPSITSDRASPPPLIPDVITLPPAPSAPFHIQAHSWRSLLRLLAHLGGTRLEPSIEAISLHKSEIKLRTVVQLIKVPHSPRWRTILYLTLDHPIPARSNWRSHPCDTTVLPYSYSIHPLPPTLQQPSETNHIFTIPPTAHSPLPGLPLEFPNLAQYLISAVRDSRKAPNDSNQATRLSKFLGECYPGDVREGEQGEREGGAVKRLFKLARHKTRAGNEDRYELVTPFRME